MNTLHSTDRLIDRVVTLIGTIGPLLATVAGMVLVWERLVTWRDVAILVSMTFLTGIGG